MKFRIKELWADKFVRGTFWITAATFVSSFLAYLVHPILTRHLSIEAYGDFQALLSFITIFGVIGTVAGTTITKEVAVLAVDRRDDINILRRRSATRLFYLGLFLSVLIFIFIVPLNNLFKIREPFILLFASINLLYSFPLLVNRAVLTGLQHFSALSLNTVLDSFSRLFLVVVLVVIFSGQIVGSSLALGLSSLPALCLIFWQVKKLQLPKASTKSNSNLPTLWRYAFLVLWVTALSQFFYNFDMLLVKYFFNPEQAGLYGAMLTIGRVVFFIGSSIPLVMFPVIASLKNDVSSRKYFVLLKSLGLMSLLAIPTALFISIFPKLVIKFVVGAKYLAIAPYLPAFAWVIFALTLMTVLSQYFLALSHRSGTLALTAGALMEIILAYFFHNNFWQIIFLLAAVFCTINLILLVMCLNDYLNNRKNYVQAGR